MQVSLLCQKGEELKKKYFSPKILKIVKLTEKFGSSYWDCETDYGMKKFTGLVLHRNDRVVHCLAPLRCAL